MYYAWMKSCISAIGLWDFISIHVEQKMHVIFNFTIVNSSFIIQQLVLLFNLNLWSTYLFINTESFMNETSDCL